MKSYSQFGEDAWILAHLPLPQSGIFVEVGAYDGIASSNTYGFEQEGWRGVCVEADPEIAQICRKNRRCPVDNYAVGLGSGNHGFYVNARDRGMSGLAVKEYHSVVNVPVAPLGLFLSAFPEGIDLLSIDTEGTELDVWSTRGSYRPRIVIVEFWTQPNPPRDKEIVDRMTADGYREVHRTTANLIFHHV
jgi:FkbM family methyltransferase